MDLSALIFVALAVAWAVYLIPKALRHHEEDALSRSVESFSDRMRVLARREAVSSARSELIVPSRTSTAVAERPATPEPVARKVEEPAEQPAEQPVAAATDDPAVAEPEAEAEAAPLTPLQRRLRRAAAARATARRRRVLSAILLLNLVVVALASAATVAWAWAAAPAALLVGWLVACRLMVKKERAELRPTVVRKRRRTLADEALAEEDAATEESDDTSTIDAVADTPESPTPGGWDPVPMTLPTYVAKAPAGRTVRTIDLDSTGVWSSGRNAADSQLAREAEASADRPAEGSSGERRASGA